MKVLVLFGSKSDEYVYAPFCERLKEDGHQVDFAVLSAHRQPDELARALKERDYQTVIGGAGLSAHLPGVIASQVAGPVFGIPVAAHFGGLDALFSIFQMPFGVPVISCAPGREGDIGAFLAALPSLSAAAFKKLFVVINPTLLNYEYANEELARARAYADGRGVELLTVDRPRENGANICLVQEPGEVSSAATCLHIPLIQKSVLRTPAKALEVHQLICQGGLWLGVNNTRNAIAAWLKFAPQQKE